MMKKLTKNILFVPTKRDYVRGKRPSVKCILCAACDGDSRVDNLVVLRRKEIYITINLFPYNPGHLMIVPTRHVTDPREYNLKEEKAIAYWTRKILDMLDEMYSPNGYNIGYNIGESSGASLGHLHLHIVPRFRNEIGFIDIIGGARVHVDDPRKALQKMKLLLNKK